MTKCTLFYVYPNNLRTDVLMLTIKVSVVLFSQVGLDILGNTSWRTVERIEYTTVRGVGDRDGKT